MFHPSVGPDEFFGVQPAQPLPHLNVSAGIWFNYAYNSFVIYTVDPVSGVQGIKNSGRVMQHNFSADVVASVGLLDRLQVGIGIPVVVYQTGEDFHYCYNGAGMNCTNGYAGTVAAAGKSSPFALGDPWIDIKLRLFGGDRGLNLSLAPFITLPLSAATPGEFSGEAEGSNIGIAAGGNVLAGWEADRWRAGITVGFLGRSHESHIFSTTIGHQLMYGAAIAVDPLEHRKLSLIGEIRGHLDISGTCRDALGALQSGPCISNVDANPLELDLGAKVRMLNSIYGTVGGGFGLARGVGSPTFRGFIGLTYAADKRDRDKDGIPDADDKCPDTPEDKDGYQDEDGCPEPDNDGDNIPDVRDKCPNQAEDFDQFQDEDGCPEPDNDQDGVLDVKDACPTDKEDGKPPRPADGCPLEKTDTDGDGIMDSADKCINDPEDKDGFEDSDGCPDVDNDNDGIPDQYDKCPNDPEDKDGFEDDDGCPDPDNDKDGVFDKDDKCPNEPETINGYKDDDGCPDTGPPPKVQIVGDEIVILEKVFFDTDKATIQKKSFNLLDQVTRTVLAHPELKKIRIEGHTDSQGKAEHNRKLSQDRAESVRTFLVNRGVKPERLEAQGFGPDRPVSDNKTSKGREANRRVEFHITERAREQGKTDQPAEQPQQ
jgi:outer membrane protein OmpA-like peptidoglycan-associated protein